MALNTGMGGSTRGLFSRSVTT